MGWGSSNYDEVKGLHRGVVGTDDAVADTGTFRLIYKVGGITDQTGTRAANGDERVLNLNRFGGLRPERQAILVGSLTTASATTTANLGSATNLGFYKEAQILVDVTATGGTASTLTIYVDSRLDGTTYMNIAAGAILTTASRQVIAIQKSRGTNASTLITGEAGAGTVREVGFADDLQVRYSVAGTTASFDFRVWFNLIG